MFTGAGGTGGTAGAGGTGGTAGAGRTGGTAGAGATGGTAGNGGTAGDGGTAGAGGTGENVNTVSLTTRISDFWPTRPRLWFQYTESILAPQRLGDEAKFNIIIHKLGPDVIQHVSDLLIAPPATGKFDALKERLLYIYEESENRQIQKLIGELELGDQKPSQLLLRMREFARDRIQDETLAILWQGHLPSSVRAVLAVADTKNLNSLAAVADKVMENSKSVFVSEVTHNSGAADSQMDDLRREIAQIHQEIKNFNFNFNFNLFITKYHNSQCLQVKSQGDNA